MAQKKRGLGRGLQALIPETQRENLERPTDVFFPGATPKKTVDSARAETPRARAAHERSAGDIAATLLAPSQRTKKKRVRVDKDEVAADLKASPSPEDERDATSLTGQVAEPDEVSQSDPASDVSRETSAEDDSASTAASSTEVDGDGLVPVPGATFAELPVEIIVANPRQPRQVFDEEDISELAESIKEVGLLQPIVVRRVDDPVTGETRYELIMGERRLRASRAAGLETIPAVVRYTEDEDLLRDALLENLHRVQLNPLEEAAAYQQLLEDFSCTHQELSQRIARSRSQISNTLRLMKLPPLVQRRLAAGVLSAGHARALLGLPDAAAMERLAQRIVAEGLSVRATEELVALHDEPVPERGAKVLRARSAPLPALSTRLSDAFDTRVKVMRGAKRGRITIEFAGDEDLARLVEALAPGTSLDED